MGEVEQLIEVPVQVVGEVGDLVPQRLLRVEPHRSPLAGRGHLFDVGPGPDRRRRLERGAGARRRRRTTRSPPPAPARVRRLRRQHRRLQDLDVGGVAEVDDAVEVLQERQVGGEQPLDLVRRDLAQRAERRDDPGDDEDRQVRVVGPADAMVAQRLDLVARRRQAHRALPVEDAVAVDVALRQGERELGLEAGHCLGLHPVEELVLDRQLLDHHVVAARAEVGDRHLRRPARLEVEAAALGLLAVVEHDRRRLVRRRLRRRRRPP